MPQKISVKPPRARVSHAASVDINPSGAYAPRIRSRRSKLIDGLATTRNSQRTMRKTTRVILDAWVRGRTTVFTADPIEAATIATPLATAKGEPAAAADLAAPVGIPGTVASPLGGDGAHPRPHHRRHRRSEAFSD